MCTCLSDPKEQFVYHAAGNDQIQSWIDGGTYDVRGDVDLDGDVDSTDKTTVQNYTATKGGRTNLSHAEHANRKGYAGYEFDDAITHESYHVRHGVLNSVLGQWTRRDPIRHADGPNAYAYSRAAPLVRLDPIGTISIAMCNAAKTWCLQNDSILQGIVSAIQSEGCSVPPINCENCGIDPNTLTFGDYSCIRNEGTICADNIATTARVCRVFAHELVHALDDCRGDCTDQDWFVKMPSPAAMCNQRACSEIRAYNMSGECCKGRPYRNPNETYEECVRRRAKDSMPWICGPGSVDHAWANGCFNDDEKPDCCAIPGYIPPDELLL